MRVACGADDGEERGGGGGDAGAARERVEGDALAEEDQARGAADRGDVGDGVDEVAFAVVPFYAIRR